MNKTEELSSRPILVWENSNASGGGEATVREIRTGAGADTAMPVIRIVSSGFGSAQAVKSFGIANNRARCAA